MAAKIKTNIPFLFAALSCALTLGSNAERGQEPRALARELLADLVEIPSSAKRAGADPAAQYVAKRLRAGGFPADDIQVLGPDLRINGVIARYRGRGSARPVLLLAHLDVVEAERDDWSMEPFEFKEIDGYFYGRGSSDNKAGAAALVANFLRLKSEGFRPSRDLVLVFTGDEETDMASIEYFTGDKRALLDAQFALNSDAGKVELKDGEPRAFMVQAAEKVYFTLELATTNPGGHSSLPRPDNAIYTLMTGLNRLAGHEFPISLNDVTRNYFLQAARFAPRPQGEAMRALAQDRADAAQLELLRQSAYYNAQMRTTCVATQIQGGHAENALPQSASAIVNCRVLPQDDPDEIEATLRRVVADERIAFSRVYEPVASPPSPLAPHVMEVIGAVAEEVFGNLPVVTEMSTGATDGLHVRNAGIPTYGVGALGRDIDDVRAHGRDERVGVKAYYDSVEYWYRLLRAL